MHDRIRPCLAVAAVAAAYVAGAGIPVAQDPADAMADAQAMVQAMEAAHAAPTAPGPFHEKLNRFIGDWDVTIRVWPMGPDAPPMESTGSSSIEWAYGDRFAIEKLDADLRMGEMVMPLDSMTITGYDNYRNQYVGTMISGMSTEMINFQGGVSPDGTTFDYYGTMHEPMLKVTGRLVRFNTVTDSNDHFVTSVYDLHAGSDYKVLEFEYVRK